ncbi:uncharacterized protein LOC144860207 [Branchiostoma floridae x Branchiostoma japonicum]
MTGSRSAHTLAVTMNSSTSSKTNTRTTSTRAASMPSRLGVIHSIRATMTSTTPCARHCATVTITIAPTPCIHKYRTEHSFALCDSQIDVYSHTLSDDWKNICVDMKCDDDFINKIEMECGGDNYLCTSTALKQWRDTVDCSYDDKIDLFCHACDNHGYHDIATDCRSNSRYESYGLALCDDTLRVICDKIDDWKQVCTHLGCDDEFIHKFQDQYKDDVYPELLPCPQDMARHLRRYQLR